MKNKRGLKNSIILMRIFIGWHFLYEGLVKFYKPNWTSFGYLASSEGPLKPLFVWLSNEALVGWVDTLNITALILIGMTLILGYFEKLGAALAVCLLAMYYMAHPEFPWLTQTNVEGSYWFINKNLIELAACLVLYQFPTGYYFGLAYIFNKKDKNLN